jgi:flagellar biosynthesis anti-sigma factor FlgM
MSLSPVNAQNPQPHAVAALRKVAYSNSASGVAQPRREADSVELSETARSLTSATKTVARGAEVRVDRIAAIKAAIASGTYSVDSGTLARAMIRASQ